MRSIQQVFRRCGHHLEVVLLFHMVYVHLWHHDMQQIWPNRFYTIFLLIGAGERKRGWSFIILWGSLDQCGGILMFKNCETVHFAWSILCKDNSNAIMTGILSVYRFWKTYKRHYTRDVDNLEHTDYTDWMTLTATCYLFNVAVCVWMLNIVWKWVLDHCLFVWWHFSNSF